jgi:protease I
MKALIISSDNFEDSELLEPYNLLKRKGIDVDIASLQKGVIVGKHGSEVIANKSLEEINPEEYDLLVLPGGKAPSTLRHNEKAKEIARHFFEKNKPVAAICHGPQILISAGVMKGRKATAYRSVQSELKTAGAIVEDKEVVVDGNLITSRQPSDIPAFLHEIEKFLS